MCIRDRLKTYCHTYADAASTGGGVQQSHQDMVASLTSFSATSSTFTFLFKVLPTVPSWYLLAIGLEPISRPLSLSLPLSRARSLSIPLPLSLPLSRSLRRPLTRAASCPPPRGNFAPGAPPPHAARSSCVTRRSTPSRGRRLWRRRADACCSARCGHLSLAALLLQRARLQDRNQVSVAQRLCLALQA